MSRNPVIKYQLNLNWQLNINRSIRGAISGDCLEQVNFKKILFARKVIYYVFIFKSLVIGDRQKWFLKFSCLYFSSKYIYSSSVNNARLDMYLFVTRTHTMTTISRGTRTNWFPRAPKFLGLLLWFNSETVQKMSFIQGVCIIEVLKIVRVLSAWIEQGHKLSCPLHQGRNWMVCQYFLSKDV